LSEEEKEPECFEEYHEFGICVESYEVRNTSWPTPSKDFVTTRREVDQCYVRSGCNPLYTDQHAGVDCDINETLINCGKNVNALLSVQFQDCMKSKYPDFKSGECGCGLGASHSHEDSDTFENFEQYCDGDKDKARNLEKCLRDLRDKLRPGKDEVRPFYDSMCKLEETCKVKLGACGDKMKKKTQAMCECDKMVFANAANSFRSEKTCTNITMPPPPTFESDCNNPRTPGLFCEENFDKYYERFYAKRPAPTARSRKARSCNHNHSFYTQFK